MSLYLENDVEMWIGFKTHCARCGMTWEIRSMMVVPNKQYFTDTVESMRRSLEKKDGKKCCGKLLPQIGEEWSRVWP